MNHNTGMQDKTISNALLALRKQIIRGDGKELAQVERLLRMRGVDMRACYQLSAALWRATCVWCA